MSCNVCGIEIKEPWICPECGEEVCDDCMVDMGSGPDDINYICVDCYILERESK